MEGKILKVLEWELTTPTPHAMLNEVLGCLDASSNAALTAPLEKNEVKSRTLFIDKVEHVLLIQSLHPAFLHYSTPVWLGAALILVKETTPVDVEVLFSLLCGCCESVVSCNDKQIVRIMHVLSIYFCSPPHTPLFCYILTNLWTILKHLFPSFHIEIRFQTAT